MKYLKLLGLMMLAICMIMAIGCGGEAEQEPVETPPAAEPEAPVVADYTPTAEDIGTEVTCPVCGMTMAVTEDMPAVTFAGTTYYLCNAEEKDQFVANPDEFIAQLEGAVEEATEAAEEAVEGAVEEATGH
jgi:YHS domain-containing protein